MCNFGDIYLYIYVSIVNSFIVFVKDNKAVVEL